MNDVKLLGRLTADPETRYTAAGDPVSHFCLAVNAGKDANGNNTAEFFNIVTFKNQAEFTTKYLTKGRQIVISGRLHNNRWTKDGQNHVSASTSQTANRQTARDAHSLLRMMALCTFRKELATSFHSTNNEEVHRYERKKGFYALS